MRPFWYNLKLLLDLSLKFLYSWNSSNHSFGSSCQKTKGERSSSAWKHLRIWASPPRWIQTLTPCLTPPRTSAAEEEGKEAPLIAEIQTALGWGWRPCTSPKSCVLSEFSSQEAAQLLKSLTFVVLTGLCRPRHCGKQMTFSPLPKVHSLPFFCFFAGELDYSPFESIYSQMFLISCSSAQLPTPSIQHSLFCNLTGRQETAIRRKLPCIYVPAFLHSPSF